MSDGGPRFDMRPELTVGTRLRTARVYAGLSPEQAAQVLKIDAMALLAIETATAPLEETLLAKLAKAYGVDAAALRDGAPLAIDAEIFARNPTLEQQFNALEPDDQAEVRGFFSYMQSRAKKAPPSDG